MQLIRKEVPAHYNIFLLSDFHVGSLMFYEQGLMQVIQRLHEP
jgi:DNA polymerase II small subunit/DNA polymerase delta subunit B